MFRRKKLTLSFEGSHVRLVSLRGDSVDQWHQLDLPPALVQSGTVSDPVEAGARIKEVIDSHALPTGLVLSSVSGRRSIFRTMAMPIMGEALLDDAVKRKLRQEIPLPQGEMDFTWTKLQELDKEIRVFVVATPRSILDSHIHTLRAAGLRTKAVDVAPLALIRCANQEDAIVTELEDYGLTVLIIHGGLPSIVRTVPVNQPEATGEARLELLIQELGRTTKFYNESHRNHPLPNRTPVIALGGYFSEPRMLDLLSERTTYPVRTPRPPLRYPEEFPVTRYGSNLGLALKEA